MRHPSKDIENAIKNFRANGAGYCQVSDIILIESFIEVHDAANGEDPLPIIEAGKRRPYTEDGVQRIPFVDDPLWIVKEGEVQPVSWQSCVLKAEETRHRIFYRPYRMHRPLPVYSTREAAEAAKGGG